MLSWEEVPTNSKGTERPHPPHAAPRALAVPGGGEVCKKRWECVRGVSGAAAPPSLLLSLALGDLTRASRA